MNFGKYKLGDRGKVTIGAEIIDTSLSGAVTLRLDGEGYATVNVPCARVAEVFTRQLPTEPDTVIGWNTQRYILIHDVGWFQVGNGARTFSLYGETDRRLGVGGAVSTDLLSKKDWHLVSTPVRGARRE